MPSTVFPNDSFTDEVPNRDEYNIMNDADNVLQQQSILSKIILFYFKLLTTFFLLNSKRQANYFGSGRISWTIVSIAFVSVALDGTAIYAQCGAFNVTRKTYDFLSRI